MSDQRPVLKAAFVKTLPLLLHSSLLSPNPLRSCAFRRSLHPHLSRTNKFQSPSLPIRFKGDPYRITKTSVTASKASVNPAAADTQTLNQNSDLEQQYKSWRIRIFYSIFIGYASFYLTRNSFTYVAPAMREALGFSLEQLGVIMSVFPLAYGFSKLVAGILCDRFSTRVFMSVGLAVTGVINIIFGFQKTLPAFVVLWLFNGFFQAAGAPPCAQLLTKWYSKSDRGTWWGFWNTSHNTGGFIIPLLSGYCARAYGWKYGMIVPGVISIIIGVFLFDRLRDDPQVVGLPPADEYRNEEKAGQRVLKKDDENNDLTPKQKLFKYVLSNPYVWLLAISYFFVYFVRQGVSSWAHIFLLDYKGVVDAQEAAFRVSGMEVGGLLGSLVSGWASDKMMRGRRIPIIVLWLLGVIASLIGLWFVPVAWRYVSWLSVFAIGFFIYGPQMLVGLAGAEIVDKSAVSSTIGLLGWIAYLGAAVSGYPLTKIVSTLGWGSYFVALIGFAVIAVLLLLPMWRLGMGEKMKPLPASSPDTRLLDKSTGIPTATTPSAITTSDVAEAPAAVLPSSTGSFSRCRTCAGTGSVMRLECGPATPAQTLSCKYVETQCPWCGGTGFVEGTHDNGMASTA